MKKEVREWSTEEMEEILKKAVAFTMAEEAPVISSLASEIFGYEHAAELDMLDVYDKINLILNNIDYYVTKRIPEVWDNMENNSKTVNLTFKQKVDENMLMRSKKGGLKKVVSEAYLRLLSIYTTYRSALWLLQHDVHIDLSSDFSTYSEKLFKGITIEETLDNFYKKAELFNKLDGFEEVNNMKLTRTCMDLVDDEKIENCIHKIASAVLEIDTDGKTNIPVNSMRVVQCIKHHPLVYFFGQTFRYEKLTSIALSAEELDWKDMAINHIYPTGLSEENQKFAYYAYLIASFYFTGKEEVENMLNFFVDEKNANHKYDGEFIIPNDFDIREKIKAGNLESIENIYEMIIKGLALAKVDTSELPKHFKDLGEIEDITNGEGENFKKFILVSAVLTTIYSFKLFIQNSSYKERIDSMDGMMSLVSDIEGSFEKLKEVLKAKEENNTDPIN